MLELGHPILGDPFYATGAARDFPRLMLHAESLKLRHPDGGTGLLFRGAGSVLTEARCAASHMASSPASAPASNLSASSQ